MSDAPTKFAKETVLANLEQEMRKSYLDYAMSVIVGRALPDVRDGLKPVHRRVLYAMSVLNNDYNKPYKKSARVVGDVIGKYHPHSDTAVYDAIVRMAQGFSMRHPLVDGQGNFGSVDGDAPAAMRYTEIRLARVAHELLSDLDKETVEFGANYDETETQPLVLPTRVPNLLVNGSSGIAVGMATNVPPHNLSEVVKATQALLHNPDISIEELMEHLPGPDFPTAGVINGRSGIVQAYQTGRGRIYVRAKCEIEGEDAGGREGKASIIVHELPYQVNKARLMEKIAELVKSKRLEGISAIRDESDKNGLRMVIELKRGEQAEVVLNNLYQHTNLQTVFGINMVALANNEPRLFNLKEALQEFIKHRREVVTRRSIFELRKARERAHILEGLAVALASIDAIIATIKAARTPAEAKENLLAKAWAAGTAKAMIVQEGQEEGGRGIARPADLPAEYGLAEGRDEYRLSPAQAQAILDLRLHRLTGLEQEKIHREYTDLVGQIRDLLMILRVPERLMAVIKEELDEVERQFGEARRTEILEAEIDLANEDLIPQEDMVVTLSHAGYAKAQPVADYSAQRRGGKGRIATRTREEDFVRHMFIANSHDTILCFSDRGRVYWLRVFELPQAGRQARGKPLVNLLPLHSGEQVTAILPIKKSQLLTAKGEGDNSDGDEGEAKAGKYVFMASARGTVKKCALADFSRPRPSGLIAVTLKDDDHLIGVALTSGAQDILLASSEGKAVRFAEGEVRAMGRSAAGVRGMLVAGEGRIIALLVLPGGEGENGSRDEILISTQNGYGKRTPIADFPRKGRGIKGVIAIKTSPRNGAVVGALRVGASDEVMLITDGGILVRTRVAEISLQGRNTQGVRLIRTQEDEQLTGIGLVEIEAEGAGSELEEGDYSGDSSDADEHDEV